MTTYSERDTSGMTSLNGFHGASSLGNVTNTLNTTPENDEADNRMTEPQDSLPVPGDIQRANTTGTLVSEESNSDMLPTPGLRRSETTFVQPGHNLEASGLDTSQSEKEEVKSALTTFIKDAVKKPERKPDGKMYTFRDTARFLIKQARIRKSLGDIVQAPDKTICEKCSGMELDVEKFLVKDRAASLKDTRLFDQPYKQKTGLGHFEVGSGSRSYLLGTLLTIWRKSVWCSFCRLVLQSLREQPAGDWINIDVAPSSQKLPHHRKYLNANCYATWQIDGRELEQNKSPEIEARIAQARTRRIRLHWDKSTFEDSYLVLVATPSLTTDFFLGRRVMPDRVNVELLKNWVDSCCKHHDERCQIQQNDRFDLMVKRSYFGVIDVEAMKLTRLPSSSPGGKRISYVALSYTWGREQPKFKTLLSNVRKSQDDLRTIHHLLPQTIKDAISLTRAMSEQYLWVDSICIVQDSDKSWELNASSMDLVYGNARFTICAADGNDSGAGLRGMYKEKRQFMQHIEEYSKGVRLMTCYPVEAYVERSAWNSRAWTFQERLLSRRCLIFTDSRVFFQCRSITMREDIVAEEKHGWSVEHAKAPLQILDYLNSKPILLYTNSVKMYTSRELTKPENILAAFQGIGNLVGKHLGSPLLFGLPRSHFDWALLWEPRNCPQKRGASGFPSWSWCGWKDSVIEYNLQTTLMSTTPKLDEWLSKHTWIVWHVRDGYGSIKLVWDHEKSDPHIEDGTKEWQGYDSAIAKSGSNPYGRNLAPGTHNHVHQEPSHFSKTIPEYPFGVHLGDVDDEPDVHFGDQAYLQFWTWSARFRIGDQPSSSGGRPLGEGLKRYGILDYKSDFCGTIVLDQERASKDFPVDHECEFIAISEAYGFSDEELQGWMYYISKDREQSEWDLYYVLLIEVKDEIAYRVGLGKCYKEAFENSCRETKKWKEFILG